MPNSLNFVNFHLLYYNQSRLDDIEKIWTMTWITVKSVIQLAGTSPELEQTNGKRRDHPWLAEIPAPVGSQEVGNHTHEWLLLIDQ